MTFRRIIGAPRRSRSRTGFAAASCFILAIALHASTAHALIVGTTPNVVPNTTSNPLNNPTWAASGKGDPGYANIGHTTSFLNGVYIGDGWVLTANHVGGVPITFVEGGTVYQPVPNESFQIPNPTGVSGLTAQFADLRIYRINDDPGLPSLKIATTQLAANDEVMFITNGVFRASAESAWTTDSANPPNWTSVGSCSGGTNNHCFHGYLASGQGKAWGTNNVVNDSVVGGSGQITTVINSGQSLANLVTYDQGSSNPFEAQVVGGDSGSAVFHKNGSQWELAGITLANFVYSNQQSIQFNQAALYGNASAFADLSAYSSAISSIMSTHQDYSIVGDLNMDGVVDANDLNTFVANWGYNNGTGQGSITSWKHGDLTHDGKVDVNDFFKWRNGVGAASASSLATMLGISLSNAVPEPATVSLLTLPAWCLLINRRRRAGRPAGSSSLC
ncbi:MAG TPA: dockerin type I repeat-containing protein [Lacipirellulaceae bacterium]|jgi:hypothetical protein|nr:dockerin type I repeat-containing protein [Lacipirellulaceae bacterium]